jgi:hypothetical protein
LPRWGALKMSSPGIPNIQPAPTTAPPPGLINTAPGQITTTPGTPPTGAQPGAPVTGYAPQTANTSTYDPAAYQVAPDQTVAGQIKNIIASGSPLMQQAVANANAQINGRGLINSSQAITAGQSALYSAAMPIAQQDATTYANAATNTTQAQNQAKAANAGAENQTSQYNAGQTNASLSQAAAASNTLQQTAQQIQGSKDVATLQANTQKAIAQLQADTSLSVEDKQAASDQIIAAANNQNAVLVQQMQNQSSLEQIAKQGEVNVAIQKLTNDNKTLLQTSSGAAQVYSQALANLASIVTNNNLSADQKTTALNNQVQQLNDVLSVMSKIAGIPELQSTLTFGNAGTNYPGTTGGGGGGGGGYDASGSYTGSGPYDSNGNYVG